jgi:peptidoglycan/LPS O-acetylase OafA/YrhL
LDSLRGLAAMSVVLCHVLWLYRPNTLRLSPPSRPLSFHGLLTWTRGLPGSFLIESSPLHIGLAGHEAVILFYLLSGFVLYLSCERLSVHECGGFLVRRVCRLYIPYVVALGLAVTLNATVSTGHLAEMNDWFNQTWPLPLDWAQVRRHIAMVGNFNTDLFLMPCWTLVHEMRISLLFPLLAALVARRTRWLFAVVATLSASGILLDHSLMEYGNYFITLHYSALFLVGASLAQNRARCVRFYRALDWRGRALFACAAVLLYGYGRAVSLIRSVPSGVADLLVAAGSALIIVWSLTNPRILELPPVRWLGKVCYGLYLLHFSLLFASIYLLHRLLPLWAIVVIAITVSIAVAEVFCRFVERPAIRLGRRLASGLELPSLDRMTGRPAVLSRFRPTLPGLGEEKVVSAAMQQGPTP